MFYILWKTGDGTRKWSGPWEEGNAEYLAEILLDPEVQQYAQVSVSEAFVVRRV